MLVGVEVFYDAEDTALMPVIETISIFPDDKILQSDNQSFK